MRRVNVTMKPEEYATYLYKKHKEHINAMVKDHGYEMTDKQIETAVKSLFKEYMKKIGFCIGNNIEVCWGHNRNNRGSKRAKHPFMIIIKPYNSLWKSKKKS